jgi:hypothetical protein
VEEENARQKKVDFGTAEDFQDEGGAWRNHPT